MDQFKLLATGKNDIEATIKESILINKYNPPLNSQLAFKGSDFNTVFA